MRTGRIYDFGNYSRQFLSSFDQSGEIYNTIALEIIAVNSPCPQAAPLNLERKLTKA